MSDEDEVEVENKPTTRLWTTKFDKVHYPATNQAHYCWQKYNEFVLCVKKNGGEDKCGLAFQQATSICPNEWVEAWQEQREKGNFLGVQEREPKKKAHH